MQRQEPDSSLGKISFYGNIRNKISVIKTLMPPTTVKGIKSFLGHVGSIGDLLKISP